MHPFAHVRQGKMERERVGKILRDDKHADKSMIRDAVHKHEARLHPGEKETKLKHGGVALGKKARHRLDKPGRKRRADGGGVDDPISPDDLSDDKRRQMDDALNSLGQVRRAKGGRVKVKGGVHVNVMVAPKSGPQMPGMGLPPGPMPAPGPVGALGGAPPGPGLPPPGGPPPMLRKKGGRVGRGIGRMTPVKAEGMKAGTQVQPSPSPYDEKDMRTFPPVTYERGGRVKAHKYPKIEEGAMSGEGRLAKIASYGPRTGK